MSVFFGRWYWMDNTSPQRMNPIFLFQFSDCWWNCTKFLISCSSLLNSYVSLIRRFPPLSDWNSLRFLKMLLITLYHQLGVGDKTHCAVRQFKFACDQRFWHIVYTIVVIPFILLSVLGLWRQISYQLICWTSPKQTNIDSFSIDLPSSWLYHYLNIKPYMPW